MIFGRRRKAEAAVADEVPTDTTEHDASAEGIDAEGEPDWDEVDARDWRADGPYDIDEVDLDDGVQRLDLGTIIITPGDGAQLRLQVDDKTQKIVSVLIMAEDSGLELTLFAAPRSGGMWNEMRTTALEAAVQAGGQAGLALGPFGTELRRIMPAKGPDGQEAIQPSRSFAVEGPRWLLRGMLLGAAAMAEGDEGPAGPLLEVYRDVIVRRGDAAMAPGEVISMRLPESMSPQG